MESLLRSRAALVVPKKRTLEDLVNSKETAIVLNSTLWQLLLSQCP
jgi:hypothetical protein